MIEDSLHQKKAEVEESPSLACLIDCLFNSPSTPINIQGGLNANLESISHSKPNNPIHFEPNSIPSSVNDGIHPYFALDDSDLKQRWTKKKRSRIFPLY